MACAVIRCLMDGCGKDELYGIDIKRYTPYMGYFSDTDVAPSYNEPCYFEYLAGYLLEHNITHFIPTTEPEIMIADSRRDFFADNGIGLMINNANILKICTSKYKTAEFLSGIGLDIPETYQAEQYAGQLEYPFIMKADYGRGSSSFRVVKDREDWEVAEKTGMVCQRKVGDQDREYTVGVFSNGVRMESIVLRRKLGLGGMSVAVECCDIARIREIACMVAEAFGLAGSINIQLREEDGKYYIFEINPRLSSTSGFRHLMGFKDTVWWLNMLDGRKTDISFKTPAGAVGVKVTDDILVRGRLSENLI